MNIPLDEVTDVQYQEAVKTIQKYLIQNGSIRKPFHFKHYILSDCEVGDYLMRVHHIPSETILTNKLYKVVSGYSQFRKINKSISGWQNRNRLISNTTDWVIIDENGKEYKVDMSNYKYYWVYFKKEAVEKHFEHELPQSIIEYNSHLIEKSMKKPKRSKSIRSGLDEISEKISALANNLQTNKTD